MKPADLIDNLKKEEAEGGCGVIGVACAEKIAGKHLLAPLYQMCNRGNGKGGGIAAVGLSAEAFGITQELLEKDYLLAIAYLDRDCQSLVEKEFIHPLFEVDHVYAMPHIASYKELKGVQVAPPEAILYFVRVKKEAVETFKKTHPQTSFRSHEAIEDELVYQNSYRLNHTFYSAVKEKRAFVLSHGKNLLVLKMVGFGDDVITYYKLEEFKAHVWIGHHRYPTKGRVWHPGGAHPFIGLNEALVHNGDFANYYSLCDYLSQHNIHPLFLTDTEVSVLIFDLWHRIYGYPLEYVIEALAPTTERDFSLLPEQKKHIYEMLQKMHMHQSPDGPWFFLIAQSLAQLPAYRLIGITDTSMLRPQVFAIQQGRVPIGFAASEKQAIDAALTSLSREDNRFWEQADFYWNARGGSYTDGGAFLFTVTPQPGGAATLTCTDKFGQAIHQAPLNPSCENRALTTVTEALPALPAHSLFEWIKTSLATCDYPQFLGYLETLIQDAKSDSSFHYALEVMTLLLDRIYPLEKMRRSSLQALLNQKIVGLLEKQQAKIGSTLVVNAHNYAAEGEHSLAREIVRSYHQGFRKFIIFNCHGQRFIGNGLGPQSGKVQIDVYGSSGDYLGSGIDGAKIIVHGSAQDQLGQIMNEGSLVVHGDVGQTFLYGAKGGTAFVRGNTAGRALINAVGKPRVVINGTSLDYLAESFMAGNPLKEGGFVIINGIGFDEQGKIVELSTPYPGSNLFSLASGGAIYLRDPAGLVESDQLNGGEFCELGEEDWELILPYLEENAKLFGISLKRLLEYEGEALSYRQVYRKIIPSHMRVLLAEEAWVKKKS